MFVLAYDSVIISLFAIIILSVLGSLYNVCVSAPSVMYLTLRPTIALLGIRVWWNMILTSMAES